jgi:hypothetical protein
MLSFTRRSDESRWLRAPRGGRRASLAIGLMSAIGAGAVVVTAQSLSYSSGQNVAPAYEGWEVEGDGSRYFLFGYMNRNWDEEIDVPVGPANGFSPGPVDRGQPTRFLPRRNRFVFRVAVPRTFTEKDELVWTLTANGKTERAYASLRPDYLVDDVVKASETGALGAGTSSPEVRANKAPSVRVEGPASRTVVAGEPLSLIAVVTDDGIPKRSSLIETRFAQSAEAARFAMQPPRRTTVGKTVGLHLSWFVYRGAGQVTFDPPQPKAWEDTRTGANSPWAPFWRPPAMPADGRITTTATFSQPGTYVLRALADDGALTGGTDITVVVGSRP